MARGSVRWHWLHPWLRGSRNYFLAGVIVLLTWDLMFGAGVCFVVDSCEWRMASGRTPLGSSLNFTTEENRRGLFASHTTTHRPVSRPAVRNWPSEEAALAAGPRGLSGLQQKRVRCVEQAKTLICCTVYNECITGEYFVVTFAAL